MFKSFLLTLFLVFCFMVGLEAYWRNRGFSATYNDDKTLWSTQRKEIYLPADKSTVFIGSSRIKFDLDIPTWKKLTGEEVIQLAIAGTSPRPILQDLANDESFKGKHIIDMMEPIFFSSNTFITEKFARESITYFYNETPAQEASTFINTKLESKLALLEEGNFGLTTLLNDLQLPDRPGVFSFPSFPKEFVGCSFDRQTFITPMFLADTLLQKRQIEIG